MNKKIDEIKIKFLRIYFTTLNVSNKLYKILGYEKNLNNIYRTFLLSEKFDED